MCKNFRDVLAKTAKDPDEAKLEIIEVSFEITTGAYLDEYRQRKFSYFFFLSHEDLLFFISFLFHLKQQLWEFFEFLLLLFF